MSKPIRSSCRVGRWTGAVVVVAALSSGSIPRAGGDFIAALAFWLHLAPQLMGGHQLNVGPANSRRDDAHAYRNGLTNLPTDINAEDDDWLSKLHAAMALSGEPAVVRGLIYKEPARFGNLTELTVERLRELYGQTQVAVFTHMTNDKSAIDMPFSEYTERLESASELLYARAMPDVLDIWSKRIDIEWLATEVIGLPWSLAVTKLTAAGHEMSGRLPLAFVGGKHVWTQVHCDVGTSAFFTIEGRKRWVLYPPSQSEYLYPYGQYRNVAYNAGLDVFAPNLTSTPLFAKARGYEVTVHPGDVLIFPSFWWHGVQNLDDKTVGIDLPIIDISGSWKRNAPLTLHSLLNPFMIWDMVSAIRSGGSLRGVFFAGYRKVGWKAGE